MGATDQQAANAAVEVGRLQKRSRDVDRVRRAGIEPKEPTFDGGRVLKLEALGSTVLVNLVIGQVRKAVARRAEFLERLAPQDEGPQVLGKVVVVEPERAWSPRA